MYASLAMTSNSNVPASQAVYDYSVWISPMFEAFPTTEYVQCGRSITIELSTTNSLLRCQIEFLFNMKLIEFFVAIQKL